MGELKICAPIKNFFKFLLRIPLGILIIKSENYENTLKKDAKKYLVIFLSFDF